MRLLLDTHALLWFILRDARLSRVAESFLSDPDNDLLVSPASYWEIAIKISLGKYALDEELEVFFERELAVNELAILPITVSHAAAVARLPFYHRDPFDRLLIAQAMSEHMSLVSSDALFDRYPVARIW